MESNKILTKKVHKSKTIVVLTIVFLTILVVTDVWGLIQVVRGDVPYLLGIGVALIITLGIIFSYVYAPMRITFSENSLVLHRGIGKKQFHYSDIESIEVFNNKHIALRICGIGGVFGFVGRYYTEGIGHYFSYVGDYSQAFYFQLKNGKKYLLSCEDRDFVVSWIKKHIE